MLYHLLVPLADDFALFNVFRYLTFRSGGAIITALIICFLFNGRIIRWLKSIQGQGQPIREDGPQGHLLTKKGTPTMGGVMILLAMLLSTLLWANLTNGYVWVVMFVTVGFGALGFTDDYLKLTKRNTKGLSGRRKLIGQSVISLCAAIAVSELMPQEQARHLALPFIKDFLLPLMAGYYIFAMLVMVGSSNAVNLTDGLDGLAIVPVMIAVSSFSLIAYLTGHAYFAGYLKLHPVPGSGELVIIGAAMIGAGLGFLWYNAPPAHVFMGDTGSLALGGMLGSMAVITKHEIVLAVIGGLFVIETLSVIIQVTYYKRTGRRIFLMAPIHHHFEKKGWSEPTIVIRFWIIALIFALIGLSTLKLR